MKLIKILSNFVIGIILVGFLAPQNLKIPVYKATDSDYNKDSFWFFPWGKSITHKGVDIFSKQGTIIKSATVGLVLSTGIQKRGGNYVLVLGPKWRFHYYAHLHEIHTKSFVFVSQNSKLGTVGSSGNAVGKPPHLHYALVTIFPYFWRVDAAKQGWKKMFYLNPIDYFK